MSLTVQHINNDSTFLLRFHPSTASTSNQRPFNILVDPWLGGVSSVLHPSFQASFLSTKSIFSHLTEIKDLDVVLVTQDKPDHCHRATLCTMPSDDATLIVATPPAAKKIRKWNHFRQSEKIITIPEYSPRSTDSIVRILVPDKDHSTPPGEIEITNISSKFDMAGLHNAIGIVYRPSSGYGVPSAPISILYTPHGIQHTTIEPYLRSQPNAIPVTVLFHSLTLEENPRILGGVVANGALSGVKVAATAQAKYWIGAHDERKENSGLSVKWLKSTFFSQNEVQAILNEASLTTELCVLECGETRRFSP